MVFVVYVSSKTPQISAQNPSFVFAFSATPQIDAEKPWTIVDTSWKWRGETS
jgi:hypothetical protein